MSTEAGAVPGRVWDGSAEAPPDAPSAGTRVGRRVRAAVARSVVARRPCADSALGPLLSVHRNRYPRADISALQHGYEVAEAHHRGQLRNSGEPFITHPLAVAMILAELGMDTTTLVAALLHDTVEDTGYTLGESQAEFGLEVAHLVDGVTKLDKVRFGAAAEAETIRKMIVAAGRDLRVLVIKLADRLHNMRTLRYQPLRKQQSTARATLDVLVPLAERLGIHVLERELETLCFAVLQPAEFAETARLDGARAEARKAVLAPVIRRLQADLRQARIEAAVRDRPRHSVAAYRTTLERGGRGAELLDPPRVLVLVSGEAVDCYAALGTVHGRWRPVPGRFKDYIAMPKFNMYQSLHTTVLGTRDEPIDVLIRTEAMHRVAEYGIAAHVWGHGAPGARPAGATGSPGDLGWLRRLLDWQHEVADAGEFFHALRTDLGGSREVLVFAAAAEDAGRAIVLPDGSTPVDLAYALAGNIGHRTVGARVNGRLVPLTSALADGDVVEFICAESEYPGPSRDWMDGVRTPKARARIRQWFTEQSRDVVIERGRHALDVAFHAGSRTLDDAVEDGSLLVVALELGHRHVEELFAAVAERVITAAEVVERSARHAP
jgi:GTP diphosphokinase / guanosine-3',5'-bis(diphosphate) 3'-diphosphatase